MSGCDVLPRGDATPSSRFFGDKGVAAPERPDHSGSGMGEWFAHPLHRRFRAPFV